MFFFKDVIHYPPDLLNTISPYPTNHLHFVGSPTFQLRILKSHMFFTSIAVRYSSVDPFKPQSLMNLATRCRRMCRVAESASTAATMSLSFLPSASRLVQIPRSRSKLVAKDYNINPGLISYNKPLGR